MALIAEGKVNPGPLVSEVVALDEVIGTAYKRMLSPAKDFFRIVVDPRRPPSSAAPAGKPSNRATVLAGHQNHPPTNCARSVCPLH